MGKLLLDFTWTSSQWFIFYEELHVLNGLVLKTLYSCICQSLAVWFRRSLMNSMATVKEVNITNNPHHIMEARNKLIIWPGLGHFCLILCFPWHVFYCHLRVLSEEFIFYVSLVSSSVSKACLLCISCLKGLSLVCLLSERFVSCVCSVRKVCH